MLKLINNAVIKKCRECSCCGLTSLSEDGFYQCILQNYKKVNPETIDVSCPLKTCETIHITSGMTNQFIVEVFQNYVYKNPNIEKLIIVRKASGKEVGSE